MTNYPGRYSPDCGSRFNFGSALRSTESTGACPRTLSSSLLTRCTCFAHQRTKTVAPTIPSVKASNGCMSLSVLQSVPPPQRARFERRNQIIGQARGHCLQQVAAGHSRNAPPQPAALRGDQGRDNLIAIPFTQHGPQIANTIDESELKPPRSGPILAGEQVVFWADELAAAARFHQRDETVVDFPLQLFQPRDVVGVLRQERIEHRFVLARRIDAALDAILRDQLVEVG